MPLATLRIPVCPMKMSLGVGQGGGRGEKEGYRDRFESLPRVEDGEREGMGMGWTDG